MQIRVFVPFRCFGSLRLQNQVVKKNCKKKKYLPGGPRWEQRQFTSPWAHFPVRLQAAYECSSRAEDLAPMACRGETERRRFGPPAPSLSGSGAFL